MLNKSNNIYHTILQKKQHIAVLIDPEKVVLNKSFDDLLQKIEDAGVSFIFIGGSTVTADCQKHCARYIKANSALPLIIFPGSPEQITQAADAILLLNLISGRNPDYLIGHHVDAASRLYESNLEILPTGYILVNGDKETSVQRVSKTLPIPQDDFELLKKTALAGVMMGNQLLYFDAGSGAEKSIHPNLIHEIRSCMDLPIIVGGGIRKIDKIEALFEAGANIVVIGNHIEQNPEFLEEIKHRTIKQKKSIII